MAIEIKDRVAVGDNKYTMRTLSDGRVELTPSPDSVQEPGTPLNRALLQPIVDSVHNVLMNTFDYVVEQGTSGVWIYRKWNSGFVELWARFAYTTSEEYAAGKVVTIYFALPFELESSPMAIHAIRSGMTLIDYAYYRNSNGAKSGNVSIKVRDDKPLPADSNIQIDFYMTGNWK